MAFTDAEQTDILRFCGYGPRGAQIGGFYAYRFFQSYGTIQFRMANMLPSEEAVVRTHLATLNQLEAAIPTASDNLDTDQAAVWHHNKNEVRDRTALLDQWRRKLCDLFAVPPGPFLRGGCARMVV